MNRLKKVALLTKLIQVLFQNKSWCGETHIQKSTFFLQNLFFVPFEFDFILYKYGPFSFDLRDELTSMRADGLLELESHLSYGPRFITTKNCENIQAQFQKTLSKYDKAINWIGDKFGEKGVVELERLATALYVSQKLGDGALVEKKINLLTELKPHISTENAMEAILSVKHFVSEVVAIN